MRPAAYPVWLALSASSAFMGSLVWTAMGVYLVVDVGMNPFELVLVGTLMEIAVFAFEVPTGVLADTYSRRLSIIVAYALLAVVYAIIGGFPNAEVILAAQLLLGLALTFESGALEAWITDEVGGEDLERVFLAGTRVAYVGSLFGIGGAVALGLIDLQLAILGGAACALVIAVALALFMPERGFRRAPRDERAAWRTLLANAATGVRAIRASNVLLVIVAVTFFFGAASEALDRLTEAHFIRSVGMPGTFEPIVWFGIISAIGLVTGFVITTFMLRRMKPTQPVRTVESLLVIDLVLALATLVFALATNFWVALIAYLVARRARGLHIPFYTAWLNQNTESKTRATVNSLVGQSDAIGEVGGGPFVGALGALASLRVALTASSIMLLPALGLYAHALRRGGREEVAVET